jgi:hypothetical protein
MSKPMKRGEARTRSAVALASYGGSIAANDL